MLENLEFNVPSGLGRATEHWRATNDNGTRTITRAHIPHKIFERFKNARVLICGYHERFALLLEDCSSAFYGRIYKRDDLEPRA